MVSEHWQHLSLLGLWIAAVMWSILMAPLYDAKHSFSTLCPQQPVGKKSCQRKVTYTLTGYINRLFSWSALKL